ncbi:hypothetical protein [Streptomyces sp. 1222.5]|uniref:hypothetical protein n=1 Tax=Streptomyces sp. 1222.5 TaxID=1881026 RepID=UPI00115FDC82|nr:hypothetical protein [Streptomyces sp. 1222.5]
MGAAVLLVLAAGCTLIGSGAGGATGPVREGNALDGGMQSAGNVGYEHAQIAHEYWAGLPLPWDTSSSDIRLTAAEFTHVPKRLQVVEYRAFDAGETDGNVIFASTDADESSMGDLFKMRNYAGHAVTVKSAPSCNSGGKPPGINSYSCARLLSVEPPAPRKGWKLRDDRRRGAMTTLHLITKQLEQLLTPDHIAEAVASAAYTLWERGLVGAKR